MHMKEVSKPIRFRQVFVADNRIYGLDLSGLLWVAELSANGRPYPIANLRWTVCAMPAGEA